MDSSKLIANVNVFIKYFSSNSVSLQSILTQLEKSINSVNEQLAALSTITEAHLPLNLVQKHPDLKERVSNCVSNLIDEEVCEIERLLQLLEEKTNTLNKLFEKVEQNVVRLNWRDIAFFHIAAFTEIFTWSEKCCKYFRLIFCNVTSALVVFHSDDNPSNKRFVNICKFFNGNKNLIFNHPAIEMFQLLEREIFTT